MFSVFDVDIRREEAGDKPAGAPGFGRTAARTLQEGQMAVLVYTWGMLALFILKGGMLSTGGLLPPPPPPSFS